MHLKNLPLSCIAINYCINVNEIVYSLMILVTCIFEEEAIRNK